MATRRLSHDYNIHVANHLVFWTTILSDENPYICLEDNLGSRIILSSSPAACTLWELEPQPEGEESSLLDEEDLDELEDQIAELNGEIWEDDEYSD